MYTEQDFKDFSLLFPKSFQESHFRNHKAFVPFDNLIIEFLNAFAAALNNDENIREFPDIATLAFFCRRSNLERLKIEYNNSHELRLARGVVFHIAPSNVPVNFAYSLIVGLLTGNSNIVRVPSKEFEQVAIIIGALKRLATLKQFDLVLEKIVLVRYEKKSKATSYFSSFCDVRVIWGGDETIRQVRLNNIPSKSFDVTFADRYSFCVINANSFIHELEPEKIALGFYNDTYLFDQNACSSPHLIVWIGSDKNVHSSKRVFWECLQKVVDAKYKIQPVMAVDKLTEFYLQAVKSKKPLVKENENNLLWRINRSELPLNIEEIRCAGGYFTEYQVKDLNELNRIINRKFQTMAVYGISNDALNSFILENRPDGVDRIVPIGRTSVFSLTWDGYDLIKVLSRIVDIKVSK